MPPTAEWHPTLCLHHSSHFYIQKKRGEEEVKEVWRAEVVCYPEQRFSKVLLAVTFSLLVLQEVTGDDGIASYIQVQSLQRVLPMLESDSDAQVDFFSNENCTPSG